MTTYDNEVPSWVDDFIIFRRNKKQTALEMQALVDGLNSSVRAKHVDPSGAGGSIICPMANTLGGLHNSHTSLVLAPNSSLYSSFSQITRESIKAMIDTTGIKIPGLEKTVMEHAFISNFPKSKVTAALHAAPVVSSSAVQLTGRKTWLFVMPKDFTGLHGFGGLPTPTAAHTTKAPESNIDFYVYDSEPGDVLFFPANTAHIVFTHPGPNIMLNFRRITWKSFASQPLNFLQAVLNMVLVQKLGLFGGRHAYPEVEAKSVSVRKDVVPENPVTLQMMRDIGANACPGGLPRAWDKHLVERFT